MKWPEVEKRIEGIDDHYSMDDYQHKLLFRYALTVPKGGTIVELGVAHGRTAAIFSIVAKELGLRYVGIDDFSLTGSRLEVEGHFERLGTTGIIIEARTQDAEWSEPIDLLFIDAGHDEANVKPDCEKYVPLVKPGGIVIFDDWALDSTKQNPHWAVGHYGTIATQGWEELSDEHYIKVFRRPKS